MVPEPKIASFPSGRTGHTKAAQAVRWRWWYSGISDWMIRNPGGKMSECAKDLKKHEHTISFVVNSDMFRDFHAARLREWRILHDFKISSKLMEVAEEGLDITLELMRDKRTKLPPQFLREITTMGLESLGYGPQAAPAVVNNVDARTASVVVPVSVTALSEAREALRLAEERRALAAPVIESVAFDRTTGPPLGSGVEESSPCSPPPGGSTFATDVALDTAAAEAAEKISSRLLRKPAERREVLDAPISLDDI